MADRCSNLNDCLGLGLVCLNLSAEPAESQTARQSDQSIMEHMMILCVIASLMSLRVIA